MLLQNQSYLGKKSAVRKYQNVMGECRQYTNRYIALQDGEFAIVRANDSTLDLSRTEQLPFVNRTTRNIELNPAPFEHWTLSEIRLDLASATSPCN